MNRFVALLAPLFLVACGGGGDSAATTVSAPTLSLDASAWTFSYSPGMPEHPTAAIGGGLQFDFPAQDGVHYLLTPYTNAALRGALLAAGKIIAPAAIWAWPPDICGGFAWAHIMVQQQGDTLQSDDGRWWFDTPIVLVDGSFSLPAIFTSDRWTNVAGQLGRDRPTQWQNTMSNPGHIGLTFGGGCFFGHGAWLSAGTARFILTTFAITT